MAEKLKTVLGARCSVLGARVRDVRLARRLSQEAFAEELGVSTRYLAGIERGERNLSLDAIDALAKQLEVEALQLLFAPDDSHFC